MVLGDITSLVFIVTQQEGQHLNVMSPCHTTWPCVICAYDSLIIYLVPPSMVCVSHACLCPPRQQCKIHFSVANTLKAKNVTPSYRITMRMVVGRGKRIAYVRSEPWERHPVFFTFSRFIIC